MKKILFISVIIVAITAGYAFAQMGHGMMRDTGQGNMMQQSGMMDEGHMMEHGKMMDDMRGVARDMSDMMRRMTEIMGDMSKISREMSRDRMHNMSNIMRDMSAEMNRLSWMMDKGTVTDEEMKTMRSRIVEMLRQMEEIKK